jgi:cell division protein FtsB
MTILRNPRFDLVVCLGCVALLGYFAWHALYGPRGWPNIARLESKLSGLEAELLAAKTQKEQLEAKVVLMRPENVDPDMLDELARRNLNWAGPQDLIVRLD